MFKTSWPASVAPSSVPPTTAPLNNLFATPLGDTPDNPNNLLAAIASGIVDRIAYGIPSAAAMALASLSPAPAPRSRCSLYISAVPIA